MILKEETKINEEQIAQYQYRFYIHMEAAKDDFTLVLCDRQKPKQKNLMIVCQRDFACKSFFIPYIFKQIPSKMILFQAEKLEYENGKFVLERQEYKRVKERVEKNLIERGFKSPRESEDEMESVVSKPSKKVVIRGRKSKRPKKVILFKKYHFNKLVMDLPQENFQNSKSSNIISNCCSQLNNFNINRAVINNDMILLDKILTSKKIVTGLNFKKHYNYDVDTMALCLIYDRREMFVKLFIDEHKDLVFARSTNQRQKISTGENDKYSYGVKTRRVQLIRRNKEGYNAFHYSLNSSFCNYKSFFKYCKDPIYIDFLMSSKNGFFRNLIRNIGFGSLTGSKSVIVKLTNLAFKNEGYGFNKYYELALMSNDIEDFADMNVLNIKKKSMTDFSMSPIHFVCFNENLEIIEFFFNKIKNFYYADKQGNQPIHYAACSESPVALNYLMGKQVDCRVLNHQKQTPLMLACMGGRHQNVRLILENYDINLSQKSNDGNAALHYACQNGCIETVKLLIQHGADVNQPARHRTLPVFFAARSGNLELVKLLIENKCSIRRTNIFRKTILFEAVTGGHYEMAHFLLSNGMFYDHQDSSLNSPMHFASAYGFLDMIKMLESAGADINMKNIYKMTPLQVAIYCKHPQCINWFVNNEKIDINCRDEQGKSILMNCVTSFNKENFDLAEFFIIERNADIMMKDMSGNNVFHFLAQVKTDLPWQSLKTVDQKQKLFSDYFQLFINYNANLNLINSKGYSPFEIALLEQNWLFVKLALQVDHLDLSQVNSENRSILNSIHHLFYEQDGLGLIIEILQRIPNLIHFSQIFDVKTGRNFYHDILQKVVYDNRKTQMKVNQIQQEIELIQRELNQIQIREKLSQKDLQKNLKFRQNLLKNLDNIFEQNLIGFLDHLDKCKVDLTQPIKVIKTQENKIIKKQNNRRVYSYYFQNKYDINYNLYQKNFIKEQDIPQVIVVNTDAGCNILHLSLKMNFLILTENLIKYFTKNQHLNFFSENLIFYYLKFNKENLDDKIINFLGSLEQDFNQPNVNGINPFNCSMYHIEPHFISQLLKYINVDIRDRNNRTLLMNFSHLNNHAVIKILIKKKANINLLDDNKRNALHYCIENNKEKDSDFRCEQLLIEKNISLNQKDIYGRTPLHYFFINFEDDKQSSYYDPIDNLSQYLIYNPQINVYDMEGNNPSYYASQRGAYLCLYELIQRGAEINIQNKRFNTPLSISLKHKHVNTTIMILQQFGIYHNFLYIYDHQAEEEYKKLKKSDMNIEKEEKIISQEKYDQIQKQIYEDVYDEDDYSEYYFDPDQSQQRSYSDEKLKELESKNFLIKKQTLFDISTENKLESIKFCLLNKGYPIGLASLESLETNHLKYCLKLLQRKISKNKKENDSHFQYLNEKKENILHILGKKYQENNSILQEIREECFQKNINIDQIDNDGNSPLITTALHSKSIDLVEMLMDLGDGRFFQNNLGHNVLIAFILDNESLKKKRIQFQVDQEIKKELKKSRSKKRSLSRRIKKSKEQSRARSKNTQQKTKAKKMGRFQMSARKQPRKQFQNQWAMNHPNFNAPINYGIQNNQSIFGGGSHFQNKRNSHNYGANIQQSVNNQMILEKEIKNVSFILDLIKFYKVDFQHFFKIKNEKKDYNLMTYAVQILKNINLVKVLLEQGFSVNLQDNNGKTIYHIAIEENNQPLLKLLRSYEEHIDFDIKDKLGKTYVHYVVHPHEYGTFRNKDLFYYLLKKIDLNVKDKTGRTPLDYALEYSQNFFTKKLTKKGAKRNKKSKTIQENEFDEEISVQQNSQYNVEEDFNKFKELAMKQFEKKDQIVEKIVKDANFKEDVEIVSDEEGEPYIVRLTKVNVNYGYYSHNLFYKMEIGYNKKRDLYFLFTNWGRIGVAGQYQVTPFYDKISCVKEFKSIFKSKTRNQYENRKMFVKFSKKYQYLPNKNRVNLKHLMNCYQISHKKIKKSHLEKNLQNLIKNLTDEKYCQVIYRSFKINEEYLPLGNITKELIEEAQNELLEAKKLMKEQETVKNNSKKIKICEDIMTHTSRYYELIPSVIIKNGFIPALNKGNLMNELRKINDLLNIHQVSQLLNAAKYRVKEINPLDYIYQNLNTSLTVMKKSNPEFEMIELYMKRSSNKKYKISNIFQVKRNSEEISFKPFENKEERRLLWHGTRTENLIAIFREGLRIAPSSSERTGNMFNEGVYFADYFDKSISYSSNYMDSIDKPIYIILAEVYLGKMDKLYKANHEYKLEKNFNSVKGLGKNKHLKYQRIYMKNGTMVPMGEIYTLQKPKIDKNQSLSQIHDPNQPQRFNLNYNEYVVYNTDQIKIRYLVEITK